MLHPLAIVAVLLLGLALMVLPRRYAVLPMIIMACFVSSRQRLVIATLDFDLLRILVLFGCARLVLRNDTVAFRWNLTDKAIVFWTTIALVLYTVRIGTSDALVNRLGHSFDALGMYFLFRCLVRSWEDVDQVILGCIWISVPVALFFLLERSTGRNLFSVFGGVSAITVIRHGRLRCQGAFSHPILAGCFWASLMPLFAAQWWKSGGGKKWAVTGVITSSVIVFCCASSTPVFGVLAVIIGAATFYVRRHMKIVRWAVIVILTGLHLVMHAPVWHLIARVSAVGGSVSWHRYNLINQAVNHLGEWCLLGITATGHWGVTDITNQYILEGLGGGLTTLVLFVTIIVLSFKKVGILWRQWSDDQYRLALCWALGVSLFVHCMQFLGVSYFGQIYMVWYLLLAMIASIASAPQTVD